MNDNTTQAPTARQEEEDTVFSLACHGETTRNILRHVKAACHHITRADALDIIQATRELKAYI